MERELYGESIAHHQRGYSLLKSLIPFMLQCWSKCYKTASSLATLTAIALLVKTRSNVMHTEHHYASNLTTPRDHVTLQLQWLPLCEVIQSTPSWSQCNRQTTNASLRAALARCSAADPP